MNWEVCRGLGCVLTFSLQVCACSQGVWGNRVPLGGSFSPGAVPVAACPLQCCSSGLVTSMQTPAMEEGSSFFVINGPELLSAERRFSSLLQFHYAPPILKLRTSRGVPGPAVTVSLYLPDGEQFCPGSLKVLPNKIRSYEQTFI